MLGSLTSKYNTLDDQRQTAQDAITRANSLWTDSQGFTRDKVFRLKGQCACLARCLATDD